MKKLLKLGSLLVLTRTWWYSAACSKKEKSATTGWSYNDEKWGGFEKKDYEGQVTGPNLVLVQGGTFTMGVTDQDVTLRLERYSPPGYGFLFLYGRNRSGQPIDYKEYLYWTRTGYFRRILPRGLPQCTARYFGMA